MDSSVISSMNSWTSRVSPSMTSSTLPSARFLIQPITSNPSAICRVAYLKPIFWTLPSKIIRFVIM